MYSEGYYWIKFEEGEPEVVKYDGKYWLDFENSYCNESKFEVIKRIQEPK